MQTRGSKALRISLVAERRGANNGESGRNTLAGRPYSLTSISATRISGMESSVFQPIFCSSIVLSNLRSLDEKKHGLISTSAASSSHATKLNV